MDLGWCSWCPWYWLCHSMRVSGFKPSNHKSTLFLTSLSSILFTASSLKCWECISDTSAFCDDPFDPTTINDQQRRWSYVECMDPHIYPLNQAVCKKVKQIGEYSPSTTFHDWHSFFYFLKWKIAFMVIDFRVFIVSNLISQWTTNMQFHVHATGKMPMQRKMNAWTAAPHHRTLRLNFARLATQMDVMALHNMVQLHC